MTTQHKGRPQGAAPAQTATPIIAGPSTVHKTVDDVDWWTAPNTAYAKGLSDGYERGYAEAMTLADVQTVGALMHALGGPECKDRGDAVRTHQKLIDARKAREAADRRAAGEHDHPGGPVDWETGRPQW